MKPGVLALLCLLVAAAAQPVPVPASWDALSPAARELLAADGWAAADFASRIRKMDASLAERLEAGTAEHIVYFALQSRRLSSEPPIVPLRAATDPELSPAVDRRLRAFLENTPVDARHAALREAYRPIAPRWPPQRLLDETFRFLRRQKEAADQDALYQSRGLSADPFPAAAYSLKESLSWLGSHRSFHPSSAFILGPGAELGSRFGLEDAAPVPGPQPGLLSMLTGLPAAKIDCGDIRPEVIAAFRGGPCRPFLYNAATQRLPGRYDLIVATNVLVYLEDVQLLLAISHLTAALNPGGCLLHNDNRFAARLFGESAGAPVVHFLPVRLPSAPGREVYDRMVIHCAP